jgi:RNA polymerase sigma factor (sigma-70 family)
MSARLTCLLRYLPATGDRDADDAALLDRYVRRRDPEAFTALVRRHGPMVYGICRRALAGVQDAEDAFQATFLVLARRAGVVRPGALASWLYGVARRVATRARRRQTRQRSSPLQEEQATDPRGDPLAGLTARELVTAIDEEVSRLPETYRLPVVLCCLEGLSQEEAARRLGWTPGSVKGRLERGRKRLHERLARRGLALSAALGAAEAARGAGLPAALLLTAARAAPQGAVSAGVASLAAAALRSAALSRLMALGAALLLITTLAGAGAAALLCRVAPPQEERGEEAPPRAAGPAAARTDDFGDPLPDGAVRRLGTQRFRQGGGPVNRLLVSPDGKTLVSKSSQGERTTAVWDLATGRLRYQLPGHWGDNRAVAISPDGKTLAVGMDNVITLHDLASGRELRKSTSPIGETSGLAFAPDGKTLASGHTKGEAVLLWDVARGEVRARLAATENNSRLLAFSPDGKLLAAGDVDDSVIRLFDTAKGRELRQLKQASSVRDLAFSPDGALLASGSGDGVIRLWDPGKGEVVRTLRGPRDFTLSAVAWSPGGKALATGEFGGQAACLRLWDPVAGEELHHVETEVHSLAYTPDGKTLVTGDIHGVIRLRDAATGEERRATGYAAGIWWLALVPGGKTLAYYEKSARFWDLSAGRETGSLPGHHWSLAFSPDGRTVAGGSGVNVVNIWDVAGRRLVRRLEVDAKKEGLRGVAYYQVAFSPDGKMLAAGGRGLTTEGKADGVIHLWDLTAGTIVRCLSLMDRPDETCEPAHIEFSPDGKVLAASGRIQQKGGAKVRLWETATGKELAPQTAAINGVAGEATPGGPGMEQPSVVFSPDGRLLAMNRSLRGVPVWEVLTGRERCRLDGYDGPTCCVTFAPDGRTLASGGPDGVIVLWDVEKSRELKRLTGHRGMVNGLAFTPDGATLISGSDDTTVLFWDVKALTRRPRERERLTAGKWEPLWTDLGADARAAHRAMARLAAAPEVTVPALKERLRPTPASNTDRLARLLRDLDAEEFGVREEATKELERLGEAARPALLRERDRPGAGAEVRLRVKGILARLDPPAGERLRELRAVEVLERIGDAEARRLLEALTQGAPEARLTREARAALGRLERPTGWPDDRRQP